MGNTGNLGMGIGNGADKAGYPGQQHTLDTGNAAAHRAKGAGFQRDIEGGTGSLDARHVQRNRLGMGPATGLCMAAPDNAAVLDHHTADGRIGPCQAKAAPPKAQGMVHKSEISCGAIRRVHSSPLSGRTGMFSGNSSTSS